VDPEAGERDESFEIGSEFFVACSESAEMFETRDAAFDAVALSIGFFVVDALLFAVRFVRHHGHCSDGLDMVEDCLALVSLVRQYPDGFAISKQFDSLGAFVDLSARDKEVDRRTEVVGQRMDLARQTSPSVPESCQGPLFAPRSRLLMGSHDRRIDHQILVLSIPHQ